MIMQSLGISLKMHILIQSVSDSAYNELPDGASVVHGPQASCNKELGDLVKCKCVILKSYLKMSYQNKSISKAPYWVDKVSHVGLMCGVKAGM